MPASIVDRRSGCSLLATPPLAWPLTAQRATVTDDPRPRPRDRAEVVPGRRRVRGQPVRRRPAAGQADPDELRPRGPALGRQLRGLSPDQARPDGQRQGRSSSKTRDGDGKADKTTVFADGLLIPTGIEPGDGGAYVANSTELLHFNDTDGDGKADRRRVVLSGFGTEDTHHILHTLRWGSDGQLYFNQSIYIHSHIETPHGVRRLGGGGIWQFRPETMELDVFIRGLVNPWGHHFDRWGQSFATDGAGGEGINYCPARRLLLPRRPTPCGILHGLNPGSPKYCGARGRQRPAPARGLAGEPAHQRLPRQPRLPVRRHRRRRGLRLARAARADQDPALGLPADRRQDGPRRGDLHRRLVQPDHPARRGRFPRPAPRPHPRPDLARHRQGPPAGRAAEARRMPRSSAARTPSRPPRTGPGTSPSACSRSGAPAVAARAGRLGQGARRRTIPRSSTTGSKRSGPTSRSTSSSPTCWRRLLDSPRPARPRRGRAGRPALA